MPRDPRIESIADLYPFDSHVFETGGSRMHYVDEGEGPPIILLHGNPTWSFYYRDLIKGLRARYRVIAPDHIGCGLSAKPQRYRYTLDMHIKNVGRLIDHLGLRSISIGGHDWGGAVACGWAVRNPKRVNRMLILNTAAFLGGPIPLRIRICRWNGLGDLIVRGFNGFCRSALKQACMNRERMTPHVAKGYLLPYGSWRDRVGIMRFIRDIPVSPLVPSHRVVREIESGLHLLAGKPMLICWGARDFCFNDWYLNEWRQRFPNAEVHRFADAGHYIVEDAHERIIPLIDQWMGGSASA